MRLGLRWLVHRAGDALTLRDARTGRQSHPVNHRDDRSRNWKGKRDRPPGPRMLCGCESEQPAFVVLMVIDRLQAVNAAFGHEAGDQLLRYFSAYVRRGMPSSDQLFRWTDASLLALVRRSTKIEKLRDEIQYLTNGTETRVHAASACR
jgi:GGDEF domain-containing protein